MADGSKKPIAKVKPGDRVRAKDPETGENGVRTVTHAWAHIDTVMVLKTSAGRITTTEDHPFWNHTDKRWQETQDIDPGDKLLTADGRLATVLELAWQTRHLSSAEKIGTKDHSFWGHTDKRWQENPTTLTRETGSWPLTAALLPLFEVPCRFGSDWTAVRHRARRISGGVRRPVRRGLWTTQRYQAVTRLLRSPWLMAYIVRTIGV